MGRRKVEVGSWSLLAVWSGIPQWLKWSSAGREKKWVNAEKTHEYMWKTLCDNITYWRQNYILLEIEWFEGFNGRHMDGCGERPRMGKFDLVAFTRANVDRIIIALAMHTNAGINTITARPCSLRCEIKHGVKIKTRFKRSLWRYTLKKYIHISPPCKLRSKSNE